MSIYVLLYELFETAVIEDSKLVCNVFIAVVVAFSPKAVSTLVVPLTKLPETLKLVAVAVPVNAGLAKGAFNDTSVEFALLFSLLIYFLFHY